MRETWFGVVALVALIVSSAPAGALLQPDEMHVPVPKAGDVGLYEIDGLTLDGEEAEIVERNRSIAFEVGEPAEVEDAYAALRQAHPITFEIVEGHIQGDNWGEEGIYVAWRDHRTEPPLVQNTTSAWADHEDLAPGVDRSTSAEHRVRALSSRSSGLEGPSCALVHDLQGETIEEGGPLAVDGCGEGDRNLTDEGIRQEVVEIVQLEDDRRLAHLRLTAVTDLDDVRVDIWYRDDIPYPVEIAFEGTVPGDDSPEGEMDFEVTGISTAASRLLTQAFLPEWIPHENMTWDRTGDGKVPFQGSLTLARFESGSGSAVPDGERTPWADERPNLEWGAIDTWGPPAGGETFDYTLEEAVEAIHLDPTLSEFHDWLEDHPGHRLSSAHHRTWSPNGEETERWDLRVGAPDATGWWITSERTTGVHTPDVRVPAEVPASENTARRSEVRVPTNVTDLQTPTIHSAIELWREESAAGRQDKPATALSWYRWSGGSSLLVGRGLTGFSLIPSAEVPATLGGDLDLSLVFLSGGDGAARALFESGVSWEYASVDGTERSTGWDAPPEGGVGQAALSAPLVTALAATGGAVLLLILLGKLGLLPFYSRLADDELLDNETRRAVHEAIGEEPGRSLASVAEVSGVARSTARYHVRRLEGAGLVTSVNGPDARRFFHAGEHTPDEMHREALLAIGRTRDVYEAVRAAPGRSLTEVCDATGMPASSAHRIVERLVEAGLVARHRDGRRVALSPTD